MDHYTPEEDRHHTEGFIATCLVWGLGLLAFALTIGAACKVFA